MSEEKPKSRWDKERQQWIHPDLPTEAVSKKKRGRRRKDHSDNITSPSELETVANADQSQREDGTSEKVLDPQDRRYRAAIAAIDRQHEEWLAEQERLFGAVYSRDSEDELVISMSERFAELFLKAKEVGDVVLYPKGDPRGFVASTDPNQNFGWRDTDAAAVYGAAVLEIPAASSEDALGPARSL